MSLSCSQGCDHAAHRQSEAKALLERAKEQCALKGVRLTAIRQQVLEVLLATHRPVGAYEIADSLVRQGGKRLAPITIYRALDFLMEQGLIHRLVSRNAFIACPHHHHGSDLVAFLICETCGGVDEIHSGSLSGALRTLLAEQSFRASSQTLEILGHCGHCA